jgi:hypothetical protein
MLLSPTEYAPNAHNDFTPKSIRKNNKRQALRRAGCPFDFAQGRQSVE